jgi:ribosomal protein S18
MDLKEISEKMKELAKFAVPSKHYDEKKAEEYYRIQKLYREEKNKVGKNSVNNNNIGASITFVNSYGEATTREITSQSYKNQQRRLSKEILNFIN